MQHSSSEFFTTQSAIKAELIPMDPKRGFQAKDHFESTMALQPPQSLTSNEFRINKGKKKLDAARNNKEEKKLDYEQTIFLRDLSIPKNASRLCSYEYKTIDRANLFEGLPYVQFDAFVRRDKVMQHIIVRDLLKIVSDKCNSFKNLLIDKGKMKKIFSLMVSQQRTKLNKKLEETIGLLNSVALIILQDFKDSPESIGLKPSPIIEFPEREMRLYEEEKVFDQNVQLYSDSVQFFRDCIDAFMIMARQMEHKSLDEVTCFSLLQQITKLRYSLSEVGEEIRIHDKNSDDTIKRIKLLLPTTSEQYLKELFKSNENLIQRTGQQQTKNKNTEQFFQSTLPQEEDSKNIKYRLRQQKINLLLKKKFNFSKNKFQTRESQLTLNQDKIESEKALILESNQKASKNKNFRADNRKRLAIERLQDPSRDPEIRQAMLIAARVLNINIDD